MKRLILLFVLLLVVIFLVYNAINSWPILTIFQKTPTATIDDHTFQLLMAKTPQEQQQGLSDRKNLPQDWGMLFPFAKADYYGFWMKNMLFPIDIIYIRDNHLVTIFSNVQPPRDQNDLPVLHPSAPSDTVLEINAGLAKKYGFKKGDLITIKQ